MNLEHVESIVALISEYPVSEVRIEQDGAALVVRKPLGATRHVVRAPTDTVGGMLTPIEVPDTVTAEPSLPPEPFSLTARLVGLFRHSDPPVGYGSRLEPGDLVGSIEAMKVLNDVRVEEAGTVIDVLVEEGAPIEYGQNLFRLMPQ